MLKKIQLLDCTLRDGAYIVNGDFGDAIIKGVLANLVSAKIDIIECGWLKDSPYKNGSVYYNKPSDLSRLLPASQNSAPIYTAMIDWDRYTLENLPEHGPQTIDAIRMVFPHGKHEDALALAPKIISKGYSLYLQAANTLAYSDAELSSLAKAINRSNAKAVSIVDTFGAMYPNDLKRIFNRLDADLEDDIRIGFHSHNNQQLSFALTMEFIRLGMNSKRGLIVDSSLCGMGRGAGNAPTELVVNWINKQYHGNYDLNFILDAIDHYIATLKQQNEWGYSTPYFIAGIHCCHVNNIAYLITHHKTRAMDMQLIIESLPPSDRVKYDYGKLEQAFVDYSNNQVDDSDELNKLSAILGERPVLLLCPGTTLAKEEDRIRNAIKTINPMVIGVNSVPEQFECDWYFFTSAARLSVSSALYGNKLSGKTVVITSNISTPESASALKINFNRLAKRGWMHFDNSTIMCLRLLAKLNCKRIYCAGFDGLAENEESSYADNVMQANLPIEVKKSINDDVIDMLNDFITANEGRINLAFVTTSLYDKKLKLERNDKNGK